MKRRRSRRGRFLPLVPVVFFAAILTFTLYYLSGPVNGTLYVEARANVSGGTIPLRVAATVNGQSVETPYNSTEAQGEYTVGFPTISWYYPPSNHTLSVLAGKAAYAVGDYYPITAFIGVSESGFNRSEISALHGVTPVEWVNLGTGYVTVEVVGVGPVVLAGGQHYTTTFAKPGGYSFGILNTNTTGIVNVF